MRPRDRDQVDDRVGRAADRGVDADRVLERLAREDLRQPQVLVRPSRRCAGPPCARARCAARRPPGSRRCPAGRRRAPRPCDAIVDAVPIVMQWPCERCMQLSASWNSSSVILPARSSSRHRQTSVPEPMSLAAELAVEHRPAGDADRRQVARSPRPSAATAWSCRSPSAARRRRADCRGSIPRRPSLARLRNSIAVGPQQRLAERHHRKLEREAARFAARRACTCSASVAEVRVAGRQLATRCCRCR